jgi:hypothetical protein
MVSSTSSSTESFLVFSAKAGQKTNLLVGCRQGVVGRHCDCGEERRVSMKQRMKAEAEADGTEYSKSGEEK